MKVKHWILKRNLRLRKEYLQILVPSSSKQNYVFPVAVLQSMFSSQKMRASVRVISVGCILLQNLRNTLQNLLRATVANAAKKKICSTAYSKKQRERCS